MNNIFSPDIISCKNLLLFSIENCSKNFPTIILLKIIGSKTKEAPILSINVIKLLILPSKPPISSEKASPNHPNSEKFFQLFLNDSFLFSIKLILFQMSNYPLKNF